MADGQAGLAIKPQANNQSLLRLLILEDSASEAQPLIDLMRESGFAVTAALIKSPLELQAALKKQEWDMAVCSSTQTGLVPKQALALLSHAKLDLPFILLGDEGDERCLVELLSGGVRAVVPKGRPALLQWTVQRELRDLAQRRARQYYEKMFRQSERRCQGLLESSRHAIVCIRNGKLLYRNFAFERLVRERTAKGLAELIHPDDQPGFDTMIKAVESGRNLSDSMEVRLLNPQGAPQTYIAEALVAHVNEQPCAQVTLSVKRTASVAAVTAVPAAAEVKPKPPAVTDDPAILEKVRSAIAASRFRLVYQPIVPLHAQPAESYEVLTRLLDEDGSEVPPAQFMPVAAGAGLMPAIDRIIISAALQTLVRQHAEGKETRLLIKLSEDSLHDQGLVAWIDEQLRGCHLPGDTIIFEIKEAAALPCLEEARSFIAALKQLHCRTALGHFGSDSHSLNCLEQLRVDFVKLAGTFVDNLSDDPKSQAMVRAVVQTAHDLGIQTIATFIQDASKMATLWQCGVDYIQGYFLQAPEQDMSYNFSDE
jgi:EAL domain-containing protein (putative c-di-GMP-specific phosphodiesterase class I)/PAS domain-containing protein